MTSRLVLFPCYVEYSGMKHSCENAEATEYKIWGKNTPRNGLLVFEMGPLTEPDLTNTVRLTNQ